MTVQINFKKYPASWVSYRPSDFIFKRLRNGAGSYDMATTADEFRYTVGAGNVFYWERAIIKIKSSGIDIGDFGGIAGGLTNGCLIMIHDSDDSILLDPMDEETIKTNGDFADMAAIDVRPETSTGVALDQFTARWTVEKAGAPMALTEGQHVAFTTQDNLSALTFMSIILHGLEYPLE